MNRVLPWRLYRQPVASVQLQPIVFVSPPTHPASSPQASGEDGLLLPYSSLPVSCLPPLATPTSIDTAINQLVGKNDEMKPYLALGLLFLETLEVLYFLDALFAPFVNVFLQLNLQLSSFLVLTVLQ